MQKEAFVAIRKELKKDILLILFGMFVFANLPKDPMPLKLLIIGFLDILLVSAVMHLVIKNVRNAVVISAVLIPLGFMLYGYGACLGDWRCMKWFPLTCFFIIVYTEPVLLPVSYTVGRIFKILRDRDA